ncbi:hypothetical protein, conserved [Trypanosoma brucei gambiense DAL972]|uniref:Uncharacterized protein n=1 Tax=Trypanosoma brucei gambiense (strain MHOM/CI/86/DAL972) TaxID=679716 RepID=C9ZY14_TRYB9|nr:hypothetical protein, conserved [Trypanosoma brucei gambiense DAL972]CBH14309.1 hypothetical protein, conserved [Trypanosoma brucei gambiense DAL972]|eukprot:XP_011776579.1 hypothetical protein, conserved [Trypanosoma brucei gambiense DAL972]
MEDVRPATSPLTEDTAYTRCLRGAKEAKERGNTAISDKNFKEASFQYKKALLFLSEYIPGDGGFSEDALIDMLARRRGVATPRDLSPGRKSELMDLYVTVMNNLAVADMRLCRFDKGVEHTTKVLNVPGQEKNRKALWRRAECHVQRGHIEEAEKDVDVLAACAEGNGQQSEEVVGQLRMKIKEKKKQLVREERAICKKMFEHGS